MEIDKYIQELLYDYDCVIVPQLGGFVTNYRPAVADLKTGIGHPPGKDIRFNKNLTKSDGLLERALADGAKISFEEAGIVLKDITEKYWSKLNGGAKVQFKRIGVLYIDDHKNLRFEPATDQNYLKASFGLDSFMLPPVKEADTEPNPPRKITPIIPIERAKRESIRFKSSKSIYWVAAATMLPFVAMSLYLGVTTNFKSPTEITFAELIPFKLKSTEPIKFHERPTSAEANTDDLETDGTGFPENTTVFPFSFETNTVDSSGVWINLGKEKKVEAVVETVEETVPEITTNAESTLSGTYHIIAGCFGEELNAAKYVTRLKERGYNAAILDYHKKLHRVRLESFTDYSTALSTLENLRNDGTFPNAWLLKKPLS